MRSRANYLLSCLLLAAAPVAGQMPDFVQLMRAEGRAVVNVSTTFYQGGDASDVPLSDTPEEELLREFLRRQLEPYAPREFPARVVGADRLSDIAPLKIEARGLPRVRIGDPAALEPGERVAAVGSPFGFERSITAGMVSAKGRTLPEESYVPFIQTDVAVNPCNSGGQLFVALRVPD